MPLVVVVSQALLRTFKSLLCWHHTHEGYLQPPTTGYKSVVVPHAHRTPPLHNLLQTYRLHEDIRGKLGRLKT